MLKQQGTGLATIEDILRTRLKGASGRIEDISYDSQDKRFHVRFSAMIEEQGKPVEYTRDEALQAIPLEQLIASVKHVETLKILIVEDQSLKYAAMRDYVSTILAGTHITHTWEVETTCRLLLHPDVSFDLILLDMTLPVDPSFDSELKSLAGLIIWVRLFCDRDCNTLTN